MYGFIYWKNHMNEPLNKMRGVWLTGHGDFEKLEVRRDIPVPILGPRDVQIGVAAAGVNNTDINNRLSVCEAG
jgi:NADPH:quinone reductase-like Zn-dependent oxidoreductase